MYWKFQMMLIQYSVKIWWAIQHSVKITASWSVVKRHRDPNFRRPPIHRPFNMPCYTNDRVIIWIFHSFWWKRHKICVIEYVVAYTQPQSTYWLNEYFHPVGQRCFVLTHVLTGSMHVLNDPGMGMHFLHYLTFCHGFTGQIKLKLTHAYTSSFTWLS
mgnify:CR=1 FL=1